MMTISIKIKNKTKLASKKKSQVFQLKPRDERSNLRIFANNIVFMDNKYDLKVNF